jgi:hypothetical protein
VRFARFGEQIVFELGVTVHWKHLGDQWVVTHNASGQHIGTMTGKRRRENDKRKKKRTGKGRNERRILDVKPLLSSITGLWAGSIIKIR